MKLTFSKRLKGLFLASLTIICYSATSSALTSGYYPSKSIFESGKWIKIAVDKSGVYEISYDKLRELGFSNPSKVGVFGNGGTSLPENFIDASGNILIPATPKPVAVYHSGEKIYFYADGVDNLSLEAPGVNLGITAWFTTKGKNIYSTKGWYFLSDTSKQDMNAHKEIEDQETKTVSSALSFVLMDEHLTYNTTHTGRYFFGERITQPNQTFNFLLDNNVPGNKIYMNAAYFYEPENTDKNETFTYKLGNYSYTGVAKSSMSYSPNYMTVSPLNSSSNVTLTINRPNVDKNLLMALGPVAINYKKRLPTDENHVQNHYAFIDLLTSENCKFRLPSATDIVFDITYKDNTSYILPDESGNVTIQNQGATPNIVIFNPQKPQLEITEYRDVVTNNLRQRLANQADMLIVTIPALKDRAERIAQIHRNTDGVRCVVATLPELYNEFSYGNPDPMAIRAAAKFMFDRDDSALKNILLFGPYTANPRRIEAVNSLDESEISLPADPIDYEPENNLIIAYQVDKSIPIETGTESYAEFYGLTDDYLNSSFTSWNPKLGVGVLPVRNTKEADLAIDKIEQFLTDDKMAYRLSSILVTGCTGDEQKHSDAAMLAIENTQKSLGNNMIASPFLLEAYPQKDWVAHFYFEMQKNPILAAYFGHGSLLQMSERFITRGTLSKFNNTQLPFMCFMGCELTMPDRLTRGIGEEMVLGNQRGLVGGLISIRETYQDVNRQLYRHFIESMTQNNDGTPRFKPLTLGESVSMAKGKLRRDECGKYILLCDPSITLPLPTLNIHCEAQHSEKQGKINITGHVLDVNNEDLNDFNGEVVIRLVKEPIEHTSANYTSPSERKITYTIDNITEALYATTVTNGKFDIEFPLTASAAEMNNLNFCVAAYDNIKRIGAANRFAVTNIVNTTPDYSTDNISPSIEMIEYDRQKSTIQIEVSDNEGVIPPMSSFDSQLKVTLDGNLIPHLHLANRYINDKNGYSLQVATHRLANGQHSIVVEVTDVAGNQTSSEKIFHIMPAMGDISVKTSEKALYNSVNLIISDPSENSTYTLYVENANGELIGTLPISNSFEWDGTLDGVQIPNGLYRLHVKSTSGSYSSPIEIPVLKPAL
ncbi:MAG: C25 family cysteine peptidase [Prevotella sp.]|nr:C25 family cysteine peptidase [Bacteroides sp.]MCM1366319.1 C25 family cysteine peptidase [Prevotella sp.]MCM1437123.1 C25 family cysteine peptidase [Prevotella sp.]